MSYHDAITDFLNAMEIEGVKPDEPIAQRLSSGELIRFRSEGDGRGRRNAWAILYLDENPAGAFGNYRLGISRKWRADRSVLLSPAERERLQREWAQAKRRRREERLASEAEAARDAVEMWEASSPADPRHAYLVRKRMCADGLRQIGGYLLVPMFDGGGDIRNLQRIDGEGRKRFLRGGRTEGLFCFIGDFRRRGETAYIGEGLATMAAVHRATGAPAIVAFSAKNLAAVARIWWSARPDLDFVICADDDGHLDRNIGVDAARAAADEIGARVAVPTREAA